MSRRLIAVLALTITVLLVGAGSLYAFDRDVRTRIADGVTVNGIDVGGLTPARAEAKLRASLLEPLSRPVSVRYKGRRFTLTSEQASVAVDIEGSVDRAMAASTDGSIFTRTWREVRGTRLDAEVEANIDYSEAAVRRIVDRVERRLEVEPRDAEVDLESGSVDGRIGPMALLAGILESWEFQRVERGAGPAAAALAGRSRRPCRGAAQVDPQRAA